MAMDVEKMLVEAEQAALDKFMQVYAANKPKASDLRPIAKVIAAACKAVILHIQANGTAGGDPVL